MFATTGNNGMSTDNIISNESFGVFTTSTRIVTTDSVNIISNNLATLKVEPNNKIYRFSSPAKRLRMELCEIMNDPPPNCSAGLKGENLYEWDATILGPLGSIYEDGVFFLDIQFTAKYPFEPPIVTFRTRIYHCNINNRGFICLDILKDKWSPVLTISNILLSICSLLTDCNPFDPLDVDIATQYLQNQSMIEL